MATFFKRVLEILSKQYIFNIFLNTLKLPSAILLIVANLIPIVGILYLNWNPYDIILLYWVESVVIGIYNFLRILKAKGAINTEGMQVTVTNINGTTTTKEFNGTQSPGFYAFFFFMHYGIFTTVHGVFLILLVANKSSFFLDRDFWGIFAFFVALMISHGFSYFFNYIGKKEYEDRSPAIQMMSPYGRVFIMHFTVLLGSFFASFLPEGAFLLFIFLKILFDLGAHMRSHMGNMNIS